MCFYISSLYKRHGFSTATSRDIPTAVPPWSFLHLILVESQLQGCLFSLQSMKYLFQHQKKATTLQYPTICMSSPKNSWHILSWQPTKSTKFRNSFGHSTIIPYFWNLQGDALLPISVHTCPYSWGRCKPKQHVAPPGADKDRSPVQVLWSINGSDLLRLRRKVVL